MSLGEAFISYGAKLVVFTIVAGAGIAAGIKLRKIKNSKSTDKE